ncbi:TrbI/VirB10 family protein [Facilibium subflavum]|uniref:TrbI/VirB10 family protein n=1 Tax=Facilibium subflavum TaxID=2219058 RepID=UPI000E6534D9|nr:TrbI/VirB10 family protein [Facilibium subflavum]
MKKLSPKLRLIVIILAIVGVIILAANWLLPTASNNMHLPSSVENYKISPHKSALVKTDNYRNLSVKSEQKQVNQAESAGQSYVPNLFSDSDNATDYQKNTNITAESPKDFYIKNHNHKSPSDVLSANLATIPPQQKALQINNGSNFEMQDSSGMRQSVENLLKLWSKHDDSNTFKSDNEKSTAALAAASQGAAPLNLIKAGDILFAVINTAINSDQKGTPVLATVVTGKYKGAKLLGQFQLSGERLVIKFNQMSIPGHNNSISINAYAIDSETAQSSLAGDINHHYLLRYGSLFAAAFLQGFGTYFNSDNQDSWNCNKSGTICINNKLNDSVRDASFSGLGEIGTSLSSSVRQEFSRPVTVKLAKGAGIGVLFMQDVQQSSLINRQLVQTISQKINHDT